MCFAASEEKGNTPKTGEGDKGIYNTGDQCFLTAADPCNQVKAEKSDAAPVERAYNYQ